MKYGNGGIRRDLWYLLIIVLAGLYLGGILAVLVTARAGGW